MTSLQFWGGKGKGGEVEKRGGKGWGKQVTYLPLPPVA